MATIEYKIRISKSGIDIPVVIKMIEKSFSEQAITRDLLAIKNKVLKAAKTYISSHKKRGTEEHEERWRYTSRNNLYNTIEAGTSVSRIRTNRFQLNIGDLSFLEKYAPYWYKINYGGNIEMNTPTGAVWGYFGRGEPPFINVNKQVFKRQPSWKGTNPFTKYSPAGNSFLMTPKKPIEPMYYLNRMASVFEDELNKLKSDYVQKLKTSVRTKERERLLDIATAQQQLDFEDQFGKLMEKATTEQIKAFLSKYK